LSPGKTSDVRGKKSRHPMTGGGSFLQERKDREGRGQIAVPAFTIPLVG